MRSLQFFLCLALLAHFSFGENGFHQYEYAGYEGLDQIPDSEYTVHQKSRAQPDRVVPTDSLGIVQIPTDAKVLFDGHGLEEFKETTWQVVNGNIVAGEKGLITKQSFGNCQLHVEWRSPNPPIGKPNNMGNSGIFFMGKYELQVFDSYSCKIYADGSAGAVYGQTPPLVNICRKPGEWQSFDVFFTAPHFREGEIVKPARITVLHNGVVIQNNTEIVGPTSHRKHTPYEVHQDEAPISFQGHNSPVEYRNIWVRN